eukprot:CAMPEP_0185259336 /NCGR_PEP_ID=MMETSP1359-20130426/8125_1 /TAXON_ID=552665 /ORGANISM="Bigelowiella longifila, Strain CCMP242" /LENGTH=357 /DNA_ID=CAMNT_0027845201 /DNA_START=373 /DNA_END=1446 /DNA_ORIENTATION=+
MGSAVIVTITDDVRYITLRLLAQLLASWLYTYLGIHSSYCLHQELRISLSRVVGDRKTNSEQKPSGMYNRSDANKILAADKRDTIKMSGNHISRSKTTNNPGAVADGTNSVSKAKPSKHQDPNEVKKGSTNKSWAKVANDKQKSIVRSMRSLRRMIIGFSLFFIFAMLLLGFQSSRQFSNQSSYRDTANTNAREYNLGNDINIWFGTLILVAFQFYARDSSLKGKRIPCISCFCSWSIDGEPARSTIDDDIKIGRATTDPVRSKDRKNREMAMMQGEFGGGGAAGSSGYNPPRVSYPAYADSRSALNVLQTSNKAIPTTQHQSEQRQQQQAYANFTHRGGVIETDAFSSHVHVMCVN